MEEEKKQKMEMRKELRKEEEEVKIKEIYWFNNGSVLIFVCLCGSVA